MPTRRSHFPFDAVFIALLVGRFEAIPAVCPHATPTGSFAVKSEPACGNAQCTGAVPRGGPAAQPPAWRPFRPSPTCPLSSPADAYNMQCDAVQRLLPPICGGQRVRWFSHSVSKNESGQLSRGEDNARSSLQAHTF